MQKKMILPLLLGSVTLAATRAAAAPAPADLTYGGPNFQALADESYKIVGLDGNFTQWLADAYLKGGVTLADGKTLDEALQTRKAQLAAAKTPQERDALARETAFWAHKFIKKVVPKFSFERGFEFANIVKTGERQCLLQSTIIAGLLQKAGFNAGLVMVWKSLSGQESNLGHVTSVLRLPSGAGDLQIDASEPTPVAQHQGILAWTGGDYRFLAPQFTADGLITGYARMDNQGTLKPSELAFLSYRYVHSQYFYYRAERAIGGILGTGTNKATPEGLKVSEANLRRALELEPRNALAQSVLGSVLRRMGRNFEAQQQFRKAAAMYATEGHTPPSMAANLSWANGEGQ